MKKSEHKDLKIGAVCAVCGKNALWKGVCSGEVLVRRLRNDGWSVGDRVRCPYCKTHNRFRREGLLGD